MSLSPMFCPHTLRDYHYSISGQLLAVTCRKCHRQMPWPYVALTLCKRCRRRKSAPGRVHCENCLDYFNRYQQSYRAGKRRRRKKSARELRKELLAGATVWKMAAVMGFFDVEEDRRAEQQELSEMSVNFHSNSLHAGIE